MCFRPWVYSHTHPVRCVFVEISHEENVRALAAVGFGVALSFLRRSLGLGFGLGFGFGFGD